MCIARSTCKQAAKTRAAVLKPFSENDFLTEYAVWRFIQTRPVKASLPNGFQLVEDIRKQELLADDFG
jgi:hypothetical protein